MVDWCSCRGPALHFGAEYTAHPLSLHRESDVDQERCDCPTPASSFLNRHTQKLIQLYSLWWFFLSSYLS